MTFWSWRLISVGYEVVHPRLVVQAGQVSGEIHVDDSIALIERLQIVSFFVSEMLSVTV